MSLIYDAIIDSLKKDPVKAIKIYSPVLVSLGLFFAMTTLPCYTEQRGLVIFFVNYVLSSITIDLMLHNMAKKPLSVMKPVLILLVIPIVAYHVFGVSPQVERLLP